MDVCPASFHDTHERDLQLIDASQTKWHTVRNMFLKGFIVSNDIIHLWLKKIISVLRRKKDEEI